MPAETLGLYQQIRETRGEADTLRKEKAELRAAAEMLHRKNKEMLRAVSYAIEADRPQEFLRSWNSSDYSTLAREWPDFSASEDHQEPAPVQSERARGSLKRYPIPR